MDYIAYFSSAQLHSTCIFRKHSANPFTCTHNSLIIANYFAPFLFLITLDVRRNRKRIKKCKTEIPDDWMPQNAGQTENEQRERVEEAEYRRLSRIKCERDNIIVRQSKNERDKWMDIYSPNEWNESKASIRSFMVALYAFKASCSVIGWFRIYFNALIYSLILSLFLLSFHLFLHSVTFYLCFWTLFVLWLYIFKVFEIFACYGSINRSELSYNCNDEFIVASRCFRGVCYTINMKNHTSSILFS